MLKVIDQGIYSTIQDMGRFGYRQFGVPVAGAMDQYAAKLANLLIGNEDNDAVLEVTLTGTFQLSRETILCITGAELNATLNDVHITTNHAFKVEKNSVLKFHIPHYGIRAYVAVKGGFLNKPVLGSRSFFKEITKKHVLQKNDEIFYEPYSIEKSLQLAYIKTNTNHFKNQIIEVYKGPEFNLLNAQQQLFLEQKNFTISSKNNRMGYKLTETIENELDAMLTSSMMPGTVQLTPSGTLIILMRDCGVTGGYPRILQVTEESINRLAQKTTNDTFRFKLIDLPT